MPLAALASDVQSGVTLRAWWLDCDCSVKPDLTHHQGSEKLKENRSKEKTMSPPRYPVVLTQEQREQYLRLIRTEEGKAYQHLAAHVLLLADQSQSERPLKEELIARMLQ